MRRRTFLTASTISGAGILHHNSVQPVQAAQTSKPENLQWRPYGNTGEYLSVIGFGGIVVKDAEQETANKAVKDAIDVGVNYFDVAPTYGDAELKLGPALEPYRSDVFLACKSTKRTAKDITEELNRSLKRLRTDHFDLYQLHALTTVEDIKIAFGKDGALEAVRDAREKGLVRHIGFSAHSVEAAMEALELFDFDSILVPINFVVWNNGNFGSQLVEYARSKGAAVLALKSMAFTRVAQGKENPYPKCWYQPCTDEEKAALALRFTLSLPVTAAIPPGDERLFRMALSLAHTFIPLSEREKDDVKLLAQGVEPVFSYPSGSFRLDDNKE